MNQKYNALAWGHESILHFFEKKRRTTNDVYPSEWFFLEKKISPGMNVLDIGCAAGGMANIFSEHLQDFEYVGIDINKQMIETAQNKYPEHQFHHINEHDDYSILNSQQFDLVLCLGILHLHETWRDTLRKAWKHTKKSLLLDLRETHLNSIEDKTQSYFKMDFNNSSEPTSNYILPYNIMNTAEALSIIHDICSDANKISHYGYTQTISELAVSPINKVMANVYCIEKK